MRWALLLLALACGLGLLVLPAGAAPSAAPSSVDIVVDESVAPADGSTAAAPAPVASDEPIGTADAVTVSPPASVPGDEAVSVTDAVSVVPPVTIVVDESVAPGDAPSVVPPASVLAGETATVADDVAVVARTTPPGPPTTVVAAPGDGSAAVSWLPPEANGGDAVGAYAVTPHDLTTNADGATVTVGETSASVGGLTNGDEYTFTVTASNSAGPGVPSAPSAPVTPQVGAVPPATAVGDVQAGGTVATAGGTSSDAPLGSAVTTPDGGTITIATAPAGGPAGGYQLLGQQVVVSAPPASAAAPLSLVFTIDRSLLGPPPTPHVQVFRDGALVADCTGPSGAAPDPCVASRVLGKAGGVTITVLSSHASTWSFGVALAPTVIAGGPYAADEGAPVALHGIATNGAGLPMTFTWDVGGTTVTGPDPVVVAGDGPATTPVTLTVCEENGPCASDSTTLTIANVSPTATLSAPASTPEGTAAAVSLAGAADPSPADVAAGLRFAFACDGGSLDGVTYASASTSPATTCPAVDGPGEIAVRARVIDKDGGFTELTKTVQIENVAPAVTIAGPADGSVFRVGTPVTLSGSFTDPGALDTHTAAWAVGGATIPATIDEHGGSGTAGATWTPTAAGLYPLSLTVTDKDGGATTVAGGTLVVFDPDAGSVTGAGALLDPDRRLVLFEVAARYLGHESAPRGEVVLHAPELTLVATRLDWLVVTAPTFALEGVGRVGRADGYRFRLDGRNGRPDELRVRIWSPGGSLLYDSTQRPLRAGGIQLHRP